MSDKTVFLSSEKLKVKLSKLIGPIDSEIKTREQLLLAKNFLDKKINDIKY